MSLNLFTIVALILLFLLYFSIISGEKSRKLVIFSSIGITVYFISQIFIGHNSGNFNSMNVAVLAILVITWSIVFFYEQLTKPADNSQLFLYSSPAFWVVAAYLIYFAGTFFLFIYSQNKDLAKGSDAYIQYNLINGVFVLIKNILLSVAMFTKGPVENSMPSRYRKIT
ncbi:MAG: hypothetical protein HYR66_00285 [Sphingobacteriales bacterium]|nr:hypothetical protein [Sphingobacteriales bacterium]